MTQTTKTAVFVGVAVVIAALAWLTRPSYDLMGPEDMVGKELPDFTDPLAATSLEVIKYDDETASVQPFKVAQINDQWSIPSHQNYPADAEKQLAEAAASVIGLDVLDVVSDTAGDHELYNVVEPDSKTLEAGASGVGTRVAMRDKDDNMLLDLIVGEKVPDRDELRYVRRTGQDPVYVSKISTSKLSTKFEDWIEADLLKINPWDVKEVFINDYSIDEVRRTQIGRGRMKLQYNDTGDTKWEMMEDLSFDDQGQSVAREMAEDEELDTSKLDDMRNALDDLEIIDVRRKPQGLSENLNQANPEISGDAEALRSLSSKGFYIVPVGQDQYGLLSDEGEIHVLMEEGVQYVLRFGSIASTSSGGDESEESSEEEAGEEDGSEDSGDEDVGRYLFVMVQFDDSVIEKPELEELPSEKDAGQEAAKANNKDGTEEKADDTQADTEKATDAAAETTDAGDSKEAAANEAKEGDGGEPEGNGGEPEGNGGEAEGEAEEAEAEQPAEVAAAEGGAVATDADASPDAETGTPDEKAEAGQADSSEEKTEPGEDKAESEEGTASDEEKADEEAADSEDDTEAERERIEKENKQKQEDYEEKIKEGKDKVKELNARFADWYYIISDEVYRKIHLGRDDIIKEKEADDEDETDTTMDEPAAEPEEPAMEPEEPAETEGSEEAESAATEPAPSDAPAAPPAEAPPAEAPPAEAPPAEAPPAEAPPAEAPPAADQAEPLAPVTPPSDAKPADSVGGDEEGAENAEAENAEAENAAQD